MTQLMIDELILDAASEPYCPKTRNCGTFCLHVLEGFAGFDIDKFLIEDTKQDRELLTQFVRIFARENKCRLVSTDDLTEGNFGVAEIRRFGKVCVVCNGRQWFTRGPTGVVKIPASLIKFAWSLPK